MTASCVLCVDASTRVAQAPPARVVVMWDLRIWTALFEGISMLTRVSRLESAYAMGVTACDYQRARAGERESLRTTEHNTDTLAFYGHVRRCRHSWTHRPADGLMWDRVTHALAKAVLCSNTQDPTHNLNLSDRKLATFRALPLSGRSRRYYSYLMAII